MTDRTSADLLAELERDARLRYADRLVAFREVGVTDADAVSISHILTWKAVPAIKAEHELHQILMARRVADLHDADKALRVLRHELIAQLRRVRADGSTSSADRLVEAAKLEACADLLDRLGED